MLFHEVRISRQGRSSFLYPDMCITCNWCNCYPVGIFKYLEQAERSSALTRATRSLDH
jgi:hypothetical protein